MILPWKKLLQQYGAIFNEINDNEVINFKNSVSEEANLCLNSDVIIPLPYTLLEVSGPDAKKFLQGQLSCDLEQITDTQSSLGSYCNIKGRIFVLFRIIKHKEGYLLRIPSSLKQEVLAELKKYGAFSKVDINTSTLIAIGVAGNNALQHLNEDFTAIKAPGKMPRAEIYLDSDKAITLVENKSLTPCGVNAWELLEIMAGIPEIYPSTKEKILPHYINLPELNAVSFTKGCYRGQEIIARMQHRGTIKRHLYHYSSKTAINDVPAPGDNIYSSNKAIGVFIRTAVDKSNCLQALIELPDEYISVELSTKNKDIVLCRNID